MSELTNTDLMSAQLAAAYLGITDTRLRQLVAEAKLTVIQVGPRQSVYSRAELDRVRIVRAGGATSGVADLLDDAPTPLRRLHDTFVVPDGYHYNEEKAHVRVWEGPTEEGLRTVVAVGPIGHISVQNIWERLASAIDRQLLQGRGFDAVWFIVNPVDPDSSIGGQHYVLNVVMADAARAATRLAGRVKQLFILRPEVFPSRNPHSYSPDFRLSGVQAIERLIGAPVEVYPKAAYTHDTVTRWQRAGHMVDVVVDRYLIGSVLAAVRTLEMIRPRDKRSSLARDMQALLVNSFDRSAAITADHWSDGISFHEWCSPDRIALWPTTFAARIVPPTTTAEDLTLLAKCRRTVTDAHTATELAHYQDLTVQLGNWTTEVDQYAGPAHNPDLYEAIITTMRIVNERLTELRNRLQYEQMRSPTHAQLVSGKWSPPDRWHNTDFWPDSTPRMLEVVGPADQAYLDSLAWESAETRTTTRTHRLLAEVLEDYNPGPTTYEIRFGTDHFGRLVAYQKVVPYQVGDGRWHGLYVVEWPHQPPRLGFPPDAVLVADGESGDRPVYLRYSDGRLDLLPIEPANRFEFRGRRGYLDQWNFGYSGGGPGALESAIRRAVEMSLNLPDGAVPYGYVENLVDHPSQKDSLLIPVAAILQSMGR